MISYAAGKTKRWRYCVFQCYQGNGFEGHSKVWLDDIYIQSSAARVEIGDSSDWNECLHREVQPVISWTDKEISITVNRGSFKAGDKVYLFVLDSSGQVTATGIELVLE